jgi:hypothetical protein
MPVRMENLTSRLVTVVLNSGTVVHLPPGHAVDPEPVEIEGNAMVRKLRDALVIAVTEDDEAAGPDDAAEEAGEGAQPAEEPADHKPTRARPRRQTND